jgi:hypothetical protein
MRGQLRSRDQERPPTGGSARIIRGVGVLPPEPDQFRRRARFRKAGKCFFKGAALSKDEIRRADKRHELPSPPLRLLSLLADAEPLQPC